MNPARLGLLPLLLSLVSCVAAEEVPAEHALDQQVVSGDAEQHVAGADSGICAGIQIEAESMPALAHMLVDTSLSMDDLAPGSEHSKWQEARTVLAKAIDELPLTASVGLTFYPDTNFAQERDNTGCFDRTPDVEPNPLGAIGSWQRERLYEALWAQGTAGGTPTYDAFLFAAGQLEPFSGKADRFVILITDGVPTYGPNCSDFHIDGVDSAPVLNAVAGARQAGIRSFVVGVPGSEEAAPLLSRMARVGGTAPAVCNEGAGTCHFDMTREPNFGRALADTMNTIAEQVVSCSYRLPGAPADQTLDPNRVNVIFETHAGKQVRVGRDPSESRCDRGWQYSPDGQQIVLCTDTCSEVAASKGSVTLEFGCATEFDAPR